MLDDRGYVVVRPDGTVMWGTARRERDRTIREAVFAITSFGCIVGFQDEFAESWTAAQSEGYTLRRCRVEEEHEDS
jgi:hypothetical protein